MKNNSANIKPLSDAIVFDEYSGVIDGEVVDLRFRLEQLSVIKVLAHTAIRHHAQQLLDAFSIPDPAEHDQALADRIEELQRVGRIYELAAEALFLHNRGPR
jgi:hypothetical protein